jgi:hypothetical protein
LSSGEDRRLEELLDAAGRAAQPEHPGWERFAERLASLPQVPRAPHILIRLRRHAVAALIPLLGVGLLIYLLIPPGSGPGIVPPGGLHAHDAVIVQRQDIELMVVSAGETVADALYTPMLPGAQLRGAALTAPEGAVEHASTKSNSGITLVKDHRVIVNLKEGENLVRFTDVARSMDPTSVRFVSDTDPRGTQVLEQRFEYDLATADTLLRRYLERPILCIDRAGKEIAGILTAFDGESLVLTGATDAKPRGAQTLQRSELQAIRLDELPEGLLVRPTLVWKIHARTAGRHDTTLSYLCGRIEWQADYVLQLQPGAVGQAETFDLRAWVTIENQSGAAYDQAGLKLLAGDVNRIPDPWAKQTPESTGHDQDPHHPQAQRDNAGGRGTGTAFARKPFFDYHLYTLSGATTLKDRQVKQLSLLQASGIQAERRYVFDPLTTPPAVTVQLAAKNSKENNLGMPLPAGRVTVLQNDADGDPIFLGRDQIDHTAANEDLVLKVGKAFDLTVERKQIGFKRITQQEHEITLEIRLRSQKKEPVTVRCLHRMDARANWEIKQATHMWQKTDAKTVYSDVIVPSDKEAVLQYTVHQAF